MGYDKNRGLGRNAVAPTKLIEDSKQVGYRGLGYTHKNFNDTTVDWNFDTDPVDISIFFIFSFIFHYIYISRLQ